eukprot:scaffold23950_cov63-Phaeocystis_antarctica.AAC.2
MVFGVDSCRPATAGRVAAPRMPPMAARPCKGRRRCPPRHHARRRPQAEWAWHLALRPAARPDVKSGLISPSGAQALPPPSGLAIARRNTACFPTEQPATRAGPLATRILRETAQETTNAVGRTRPGWCSATACTSEHPTHRRSRCWLVAFRDGTTVSREAVRGRFFQSSRRHL